MKPVQNNALIGNSAEAIGRMFGKPRLDVTEGAGEVVHPDGQGAGGDGAAEEIMP